MTLPLNDGRVTVPANRWDLLADRDTEPARIAVVIPHYQQQRQLELTLGALELQDHPRELVEVVVADDGSAEPPRVPESSLRISVVRQDDRGFRAAAARNLGAAQSNAEVLCFLDADTVPEPSYLRRVSRLPAMLPDALVVGRRRHADLTGWTARELPSWWAGDAAPPVLEEPRWLSDEYHASGDLLRTDHRSYRYVISSVMCCSRDLFVDVGGFDESFVGYGGEDWEFAHRAVVNGAVLHHARDAVAWHDGADWGARDVADRAAAKNHEALAVARLVTDPDARRSGLHYAVPDVAVEVDTTGHAVGSLVATLGSLLGLDVGIWLVGEQAESLLHALGVHDSRINAGPVPEWIRRRCRFTISTSGRPVLPHEAVTRLLALCDRTGVGSVRVTGADVALTIRASWAANRARRWTSGSVRLIDAADVDRIGENVVLAAESVGMGSASPDASLAW